MSGLPIRNGNRHAGEIASMSLNLLEEIKHHKIAHQPEATLKLRIGIHTGIAYDFHCFILLFIIIFGNNSMYDLSTISKCCYNI